MPPEPNETPEETPEIKPEDKPLENKPGAKGLLDLVKPPDDKPEDKPEDKPVIPERPENVPEKFWDVKEGKLRQDSVLKAFDDTQKELSRLQGDVKPVKDASEYLTEDMVKDGKLIVPEGLDEEILIDDPVLVRIMDSLQAKGIAQELGTEILKDLVTALGENLDPILDLDVEITKLGDNGRAVVEANHTWVESLRSTDTITEQQEKMLLSFSADAAGMQVLNILRMETGEKPIPLLLTPLDGGAVSLEKWEAMMEDPKYQSDPAWRKKTHAYGEKVHGTGNASSTEDVRHS